MSDGEDYVKADHLSDGEESGNRRKNQRSVSPHRRHSSSRHSGNRDLSPAPRHSRSRSRDGSPRPRSRSPSLRRSRSRSRRRSYTRSRSRSRSRRYRSRHYDSRSRSRSPRRRRYSRSRRSRSVSPMSNRRRHVGNRENPQPTRCLGVFGLSLYTQERDLRDVFSKYGAVEEVQVVYDAQTGRSRGFSFVYFENVDDAQMAKERCNGLEVDGRRIRVDYSITQRAHTPTPGIYMGKPTGGSSGRRTPSPSGPSYQSGGGRYSGGYAGGGGGGGGGGSYRRSPSPYYSSRRSRYSRSRSRSYSPRRY